jgi:hypothetical protein
MPRKLCKQLFNPNHSLKMNTETKHTPGPWGLRGQFGLNIPDGVAGEAKCEVEEVAELKESIEAAKAEATEGRAK